jgi:hypothetical protein
MRIEGIEPELLHGFYSRVQDLASIFGENVQHSSRASVAGSIPILYQGLKFMRPKNYLGGT